MRDIEEAFRSDDGSLLLSHTAVSEIGEGRPLAAGLHITLRGGLGAVLE